MVAQQPGQAPKVSATDCYDSSHASMAAQPAQHSTLPSPHHNMMSWPLGSAKNLSESALSVLLLLSPSRTIPQDDPTAESMYVTAILPMRRPDAERLRVANCLTITSRWLDVHMNGPQQGPGHGR
jgi:hypothetical protein